MAGHAVSASFQVCASGCVPNAVPFHVSPPFCFSKHTSSCFSLSLSFCVSSPASRCASCPCLLLPCLQHIWAEAPLAPFFGGSSGRRWLPPWVSEPAGTSCDQHRTAHGLLPPRHPTGPGRPHCPTEAAGGALPVLPELAQQVRWSTSRARGLFPEDHEDS